MYDLLRIGTSCNQNCVFCFNKNRSNFELSSEDVKESIKSLSEIQKDFICFSGGEPTLRKDISEMISYAKKHGFKVIGIQTNGMLLEDQGHLQELVNHGLNYIYFSLHSYRPEISDILTGVKGGFDRTLKAINNALNLNLDVELNYVINSENYTEIVSFVKFIESISNKIKIEFSFMVPLRNREINKRFLPRLSLVKPFLIRALDYCSEKGIIFTISSCSIPYCFCGNYIDKCVELKHMIEIRDKKEEMPDHEHIKGMSNETRGVNLWSKQRKKTDGCLGCTLYDYCNGSWIGYTEIYGSKELKPILENKLFEFQSKRFFPNKKETVNIDIRDLEKINEIENNSKISFELCEKELNEKTGKKIIEFLRKLNKKRIRFMITKPLPRCLFGGDYYNISKEFSIPRNCRECHELFNINKEGRIVYCKILKKRLGPKLDFMRDRDQIYEYFKTFYAQLDCFGSCKSCIYFLRGQCNWCNRKTK